MLTPMAVTASLQPLPSRSSGGRYLRCPVAGLDRGEGKWQDKQALKHGHRCSAYLVSAPSKNPISATRRMMPSTAALEGAVTRMRGLRARVSFARCRDCFKGTCLSRTQRIRPLSACVQAPHGNQ